MALCLEDKKAIVAEVSEVAQHALSAVIAEYRGLTVDEMTSLRKQARADNVYLKIVRNTLAKRAVEGTDYECITDALVGPVVLAFSKDDPGAAARLIKGFSKEHEALIVKALSISGKLLPAEQIDILAKMPTLDQARSLLMAAMMAPVTKLARTFKEVPAKITRVMAAVAEKKKQAA